MYVSNTIQASISQLNATGIDADLNMGAQRILTNHIAESTAGHGFILDSSSNAGWVWAAAMGS